MTRKYLAPAFCACALLIPAVTSAAYNKAFMVEVHGGFASPDESIGDADLDPGFNFGTSISYNFLNDLLGVYVEFGGDSYEAFSNSNFNVDGVVLYGYGVGMSHQGKFGPGRLGYFVRIGFHNSQLFLVDDDGDDIDKTRYNLGFQSSGGLSYNLSENWALRGGLQLKTFAEPLRRTNVNSDAELDSVTLTFGGTFRF